MFRLVVFNVNRVLVLLIDCGLVSLVMWLIGEGIVEVCVGVEVDVDLCVLWMRVVGLLCDCLVVQGLDVEYCFGVVFCGVDLGG